ncbi:helix-turn-helix transcriptional regulator [Ensifer sp. NBAIM29]|nr:helix-turn-helix transcriptional regulator [Ensifer sp. NBAIM29]
MAEVLSRHALSTLIGSIYDCALEPDRWEGTLAAIMDAFAGRTAILTLVDQRHDRLVISRTVGIEPQQLEDVSRHAPEINARVEEAFAAEGFSLDAPYSMARHWSQHFDTSPYVAECLKPYGIVDILQYFLFRTPTHYSVAAWARHERYGVYGEREFELGGLLLPHLRRAVTIGNALDLRSIEQERMAEALDALRCGVVLTDGCAVILHANRSAEKMLRNDGPLQDCRGALHAKAPHAAKELQAAIALAAEDEAKIGKAGLAIRLTEVGEAPIFAHVLPLTSGDLRTRLLPAAVAAVFIGATQDEDDAADVLAAAYGLTPAERRVLASLLVGRTLTKIAVSLGIRTATAKTHLDNIFLKTGTCRQIELVRLAMRVAPTAERCVVDEAG